MKNLFVILLLIFSLSNCKDKTPEYVCEGPDCPLEDGSHCPGNLANIDNNCVCPEGTIMLNDSVCFDPSSLLPGQMHFYNEFTCDCLDGSLRLILSVQDQDINGSWGINTSDLSISYFLQFSSNSTGDIFDATLNPMNCDGRMLKIHGGLQNDTLIYSLYLINPLEICSTDTIIAL